MSNNETEYLTEISIVWNVYDINTVIRDKGWNFSPELTEQEKARVLYEAERHHDANVGINWDVLAYWIMDLYAYRMVGQISTEEEYEDEESW
jgi:hypothetical protein